MRALITGATGFIGSNLVNSLIQKGWEVDVLVRQNSIHKITRDKKIKIIIGDLDNLDELKKQINQIEVVFNLAGALPYHRLKDRDYWKTNVEGVNNLLNACKKSNIKRFVHVSTTGIYGATSWANEKSPLQLDSAYAKSKAAGEKLVLDCFKKENIPITVIRPTIAYGPRDTRPGFSNLFPMIKKRIFIPIGKGKNYFHTVYVGNLIEALLLAATKKEAIGEDFIIGDDPCPTMNNIIKTIAKVEQALIWPFYIPEGLAYVLGRFFDVTQCIGVPQILNTQRVIFITENKRFDINKAREILGYKAKIDLEEGVRRTYCWYLKNHYL